MRPQSWAPNELDEQIQRAPFGRRTLSHWLSASSAAPWRPHVRTLTLALLISTCAAFVGCGGDPPPERTPREVPVRRTGEEVAAPAEGLLAPVDEWKAKFAELVPTPWKLDRIEQQIVAPHGWTRIKGPRGLYLVFTNGTEEQGMWVMGATFGGKTTLKTAAVPDARNDEFALYVPYESAKGWTHTPAVAASLGLKK